MENTLNLLLQDTQAKWFSVENGRPQGPLSSKEVVLRIQSGALNFGSHLWTEGYSAWTRIYGIKDFQCLLSAEPSVALIDEIRKSLQKPLPTPPPVRKQEEERLWFVYVDNSQYGPFTITEVGTLVDSNRVTANTYVWRKGFADWKLATAIPELGSSLAKQQIEAVIQKAQNKRQSPRKPLEARILLTNGQEVGSAVCRDISVGGMQVLMDTMPGEVGTLLRLNFTSTAEIPSFACEGVLARILEDGRGFSFRFVNLPKDAEAAIEKYIQSA